MIMDLGLPIRDISVNPGHNVIFLGPNVQILILVKFLYSYLLGHSDKTRKVLTWDI